MGWSDGKTADSIVRALGRDESGPIFKLNISKWSQKRGRELEERVLVWHVEEVASCVGSGRERTTLHRSTTTKRVIRLGPKLIVITANS